MRNGLCARKNTKLDCSFYYKKNNAFQVEDISKQLYKVEENDGIISENIDLDELNGWIREKLPSYRVPRNYIILDALPRNNMGKVTKNELKKMF